MARYSPITSQHVLKTRLFQHLDPQFLAADSPLRTPPNVMSTPRIAGVMNQARRQMGKLEIDETLRFLRNEPLQHEVTRAMLASFKQYAGLA